MMSGSEGRRRHAVYARCFTPATIQNYYAVYNEVTLEQPWRIYWSSLLRHCLVLGSSSCDRNPQKCNDKEKFVFGPFPEGEVAVVLETETLYPYWSTFSFSLPIFPQFAAVLCSVLFKVQSCRTVSLLLKFTFVPFFPLRAVCLSWFMHFLSPKWICKKIFLKIKVITYNPAACLHLLIFGNRVLAASLAEDNC